MTPQLLYHNSGASGTRPVWSPALPSLPESCFRVVVMGWPLSSKDISEKLAPVSNDLSALSSPDSGQGPLLFLQPLLPDQALSPSPTSLSERTGGHLQHHRLTWELRPLGQDSSSPYAPGPCPGVFKLGMTSHPAPAQPHKGTRLPPSHLGRLGVTILVLCTGRASSNSLGNPCILEPPGASRVLVTGPGQRGLPRAEAGPRVEARAGARRLSHCQA